MKKHRSLPGPGLVRGLAAAIAVMALTMGGAMPATAQRPSAAPDRPAGAPVADPALHQALQRDLGLNAAEVDRLLAATADAAELEVRLREDIADEQFAGSWFDHTTGSLTVAVTDPEAATRAAAAGAETTLVEHSEQELTAIIGELDALVARDPAALPGVVSWRVDVPTNQVVVTVLAGRPRLAVSAQVADYGDAVRIEQTEFQPRTTQEYPTLEGGLPYNGCTTGSVAVSATTGKRYVMTAGHCGPVGTLAVAGNGVTIGPVVESVFPGSDYGLIEVTNTSYWQAMPSVWTWGATPPRAFPWGAYAEWESVGAPICKSGRTTGWTCGVATAFNESVLFTGGNLVHGLTRHDACSEPGDSGGPNLGVGFLGHFYSGTTTGGQLTATGQCLSKIGRPNVSWYFPFPDPMPVYQAKYGIPPDVNWNL